MNRFHGCKLAIAQVCSQKCISDVSTLHHIVICGRAIYLKWSVKEFIKDIVAVISQILIKDYKKITKAVVATRESEKHVRVTSDGLLVCTSDKFNGPVIKKNSKASEIASGSLFICRAPTPSWILDADTGENKQDFKVSIVNATLADTSIVDAGKIKF